MTRTMFLAALASSLMACADFDIDVENNATVESEIRRATNQVILDWNLHTDTATVMEVPTVSPPRRARAFAMVQLAVHDAVNGVVDKFDRFASSATDHAANADAALAQAAHDVLVGLFPSQQLDLDAKLATSLAGIHANHNQKNRGIALGAKVAADILAARASDGSNVVGSYTVPPSPGIWRPTPPAFLPALEPNWPNVTPFGLEAADQFPANPPFEITSAEYARELAEVRSVGQDSSLTRTLDETHYAHFWYEPSANGWNRLARTAVELEPHSAVRTARMFAQMNMALADAYVASFDAKYTFNQWRPITGIREADTDCNPATDPADPTWTPLRPTPPMPDHISGHSAAGWAAYPPLVAYFRSDGLAHPIEMSSVTALPTGSTRSWNTFSEAAAENSDSRVKVGIHWRKSVVDGEIVGRAIGDFVVHHRLGRADDCDDDE